jgi:hypothetical protein
MFLSLPSSVFSTCASVLLAGFGTTSLMAQQCETELGQLLGRNGQAGQFAGLNSLAIEGQTVAMGTGNFTTPLNNEAVLIYNGSGGSWSNLPNQEISQSSWLPDTNVPSAFGRALDLEGDLLVVGAPYWSGTSSADAGKGQARIYRRTVVGGPYVFEARLFDPTPAQHEHFGAAIAISSSGEVFVGVPDAAGGGSVVGFKKNGGNWTVNRLLWAPDGNDFAYGTSLACDGDFLVVGATKADTAFANNAGAAYAVYVGPGPVQQTKLAVPSAGLNQEMGRNVTIAGDWIGISGGTGQPLGVFLFARNDGAWATTPTQTLSAPNQSQFGAAIAMSNKHLVVGSPFEGPTGSCHSYERSGNVWTLDATMVGANQTLIGANMGLRVAIDGLTAVFADPLSNGIPGQILNDRGVSFVFALDGEVGTNYCGGTVPNSTGATSKLIGRGSDYATVGCLNLVASDLPPTAFGLFVMSSTQASIPNFDGGLGTFCLGSPFLRLPTVMAGANGIATLALDFANLPGGASFLSGTTWNFQLWHRDVPATNTTNGLAVTFK